MTVKQRERELHKYNGHCGYCGKSIDLTTMQVDHIEPKKRILDKKESKENIYRESNLMPSCRRCNHYKRAMGLEAFRSYMMTLHERIAKQYIAQVAIDYHIISIKPFNGKFYFEVMDEMKYELEDEE